MAFINPLFYWESQMYLATRIADIFITIGMTLTSKQNISRMPSRIKLRSLLIPLSLPIAFKKRFCCNDFHLNLWPSCSLINILSHKSYIGNIIKLRPKINTVIKYSNINNCVIAWVSGISFSYSTLLQSLKQY